MTNFKINQINSALQHLSKITENEAYSDYFQDVCKIAVKALEKQIPKELDYEGDGYDENGDLIYDYAKCRVCGHDFEYGINDWGCKYCSDCGQALDWGQEE